METNSPILAPVIALAAWTMVMWLWMYATRLPAMKKADIDIANYTGGVGKDLDKILPPEIQWKAHNYNHLLEQPVIFYAVALTLALVGEGTGWSLWLAWAYVALRVVHSLIQATFNRVVIRFQVFLLASIVLIALVVRAALFVF